MSPAPSWTVRILVGVDGSPASLSALRWAAREARLRSGEVVAVRSWQGRPPSNTIAARRPPLTRERERARRALARDVQAVLGPEPAVRVHRQLAYGHPAHNLLRLAAQADLLVLGDTPTDHGPVRTACLRMSPCPVILIPADRPTLIEQPPETPAPITNAATRQ